MSESSKNYLQINRGGVSDPTPESFPPVVDRVGQHPDAFKADLGAYATTRTTLQWADACNLRCDGCYAKPYLPHGRSLPLAVKNPRKNSYPDHSDHIAAHGEQLADVYYLGLEPTMFPEQTRNMLTADRARGLGAVAATNGSNGIEAFESSFGEAIKSGQLSRINVSLDSINPTLHDKLRGRKGACNLTLETIKYCIERNYPLQVTMTVWADNYSSTIESIEELYRMGVRGFVFHEGSLEGANDHKAANVVRVDPLAWRILVGKLHDLKIKYGSNEEDPLEHFVFPYIYFTEDELRSGVIGDDTLTNQYLEHTDKLARGEESNLPFIACPAVDVPQVYVFGNDGKFGAGAVSLCNMHTIQTKTYLGDYNPATKRFETETDPEKNQLSLMAKSEHLCPAQPGVMRDGNKSDRYETPSGALYHACRYISSNQFPGANNGFGKEYGSIADKYYDSLMFSRSIADKDQKDALERIHGSPIDYFAKMRLIGHVMNRVPLDDFYD